MGRTAKYSFTDNQKQIISEGFYRRLKQHNCDSLSNSQLIEFLGIKNPNVFSNLRNAKNFKHIPAEVWQMLNTMSTSKFEEMSKLKPKISKRGIRVKKELISSINNYPGPASVVKGYPKNKKVDIDKLDPKSGTLKNTPSVDERINNWLSAHGIKTIEDLDKKLGLEPIKQESTTTITIIHKFDMTQIQKIIGMVRFGDDKIFNNK